MMLGDVVATADFHRSGNAELTGVAAVDRFVAMTKRGKAAGKAAGPETKTAPERWRGEEVEDRPGDEAERDAERAEGNTPVPASVERERTEEPDLDQQPQRLHPQRRHTDDPEEEIAETAEEHQERRDAGERPPRGKL